MKNIIVFFSSVFIALFFAGCGACITAIGDPQEEERSVSEFSAVTLDCSADVIIRDRMLSDKNKVIVKAAANILPLISTKVSRGNLTIDIKGCVAGKTTVEVFVYANEISKVSNDGSGTIRSDNVLKADHFEVNHDSSGDIELKLRANRIKVNHDGSGILVLHGNTNSLEIDHDSSGESELSSLKAEDAKVNLDGSGTVSVFATNKMDLSMDGSGTIIYKGNPKKLNTKKDGSGEIREAK